MIENEFDQSRFATLYNKYIDETLFFAESIVRNKWDAEDVCQETWFYFSQVFDLINFENETAAKAYIMRITKHKSFDFLQKSQRVNAYMEKNYYEELLTNQEPSDDPLILLCHKETIESLYEGLKSLDEIYREALIFYYLDGFAAREISEMLDINIETVYERISRGRNKLMEKLKEKGVDCNE